MRKRGRTDTNQKEIVEQLREIPGVSVKILSGVGDGFPDLIVGNRGYNFLIELKDGKRPPSEKKLTTDEKKFFEMWTGSVDVCENFEEVLTVINTRI